MENWTAIRQDVLVHGLSQRAACEKYKLGWHTLKKILAHVEPPGYRQKQARPRRALAPVSALASARVGQRAEVILNASRSGTRHEGASVASCDSPTDHTADTTRQITLPIYGRSPSMAQLPCGYRESTKLAPSTAVSSVADTSSPPASEPKTAAHSTP